MVHAPAYSATNPAPDNNFNIMRLIAAWLILFGHAYALYDRSTEPFVEYLKLPAATFFALGCFFTISGYLVTASWYRQPGLRHFAANRALRIFPALAVTILFTTFILGPLATTLAVSEYFAHSDTWKYVRSVFGFGLRYVLPGVFETLPYPNAVNGSLWSLKLELQCYIIVALLGVIGLVKPRILPLLAIGCFVVHIWLASMAPDPPRTLLGMKYVNMYNFTKWTFFFWAGSCLFLLKDRIPYSRRFKITVPLLAFAAYYLIAQPYGHYVLFALLPYMVIQLALHVRVVPTGWLKKNDLSYGVYLYAFPFQQFYMLYIGNSYGISGFILVTTLFTFAAAWLSWRYVESYALRLKPSKQTLAKNPPDMAHPKPL